MEDRIRLHLFTDEVSSAVGAAEESKWLVALLQAGLDYLHIRRPNASREEIEGLFQSIPVKFHHQIILHDYPDLIGKYNCGFQLNHRHTALSEDELGKTGKGKLRKLSRSCHTPAEVEKSLQTSELDFVTLSPIFDSISKIGYKSQFIPRSDQKVPKSLIADSFCGIDLSKVVALGGVTLETVPMLKTLGFGGAALLGDIWRRPDGVSRLLKYLHMRNFSLQFITDGIDAEETVAQALEILKGGGRWIQVRMKEARKEEVAEALQRLSPICRDYGATLLVDDHFDLAKFCDGVHLGQEDTPVTTVREYLSPEKIVGLTVNNRTNIAESLEALPDYYGVGPFRFTATKKCLAPVLGLDGYRSLKPYMTIPFVAIGGITADDIPGLIGVGASGIAVSSVITRSVNPRATTAKLIKIINDEKRKINGK